MKSSRASSLNHLGLFSFSFIAVLVLSCNVSAQKTDTLQVGTTSWVCPVGVYSIQVECWGGGGSGGGGASGGTGKSGGGGAGGSYVKNTSISVVPGITYTITVGSGGAPGGTASASPSNPGGNTTFVVDGTTSIVAVGGLGGKWGSSGTPSTTVSGSTAGNIGFEASYNYSGGDGIAGLTGSYTGGGGAGAGSLGAGAIGIGANPSNESIGTGGGGNGAAGVVVTNSNGFAGKVPGGGGSGGWGTSGVGKAGGAGGAGRIIVTYSTGPAIPKWTAGWPKVEITSYTSFTAKVNTNVVGNVYFVVLPSAATAPTTAQIKSGQDATSTTVSKKGTIVCSSSTTEFTIDIMGLSESTSYDVYFAAEDEIPTLQTTPAFVSISFGSSLKADQTINFSAISNKVVGDADFSPSASATSDLAISYISSNTAVANIVNGNIHIIGSGTTSITASQSGDALYNAAQSISQTLTVTTSTKQNQTINFSTIPSKSITDVDFSAGATATSGLTVSLASLNTNVATIVSGQIHIVGNGTSIITASQSGDATYNAASDVSQLLTVTGPKQNQTITFPNFLNKNIGDADFNPSATTDAIRPITTNPNLFLNTTRFSAVTVTSGVKFATVTNYKGVVQDLYCDIYQPNGDVSTDRPCIIWMHGGGFRTGSVRTQGYIVTYATAFAKRGYVCISIDYRLRAAGDMPTQASEFPALQDASRDANTALDWVRTNAANYNVNSNYLFYAGGSAGGRTAATAAEFDGPDPTASTAPETSYKTKAWDKTGLIAAGILWGGEEVEMRDWTYPYLVVNPIPAVLVHGDADTTIPVQNSIDLAAAMTTAGVTNELHIIPGAAHTPTGATNDPNIQKWVGDFFVKEWNKVLPSGTYSITYTSSNPNVATIVNGKIHIVGNGITTITATQVGDATYNSATISQTLTVGTTAIAEMNAELKENFEISPNPAKSGCINLNLTGYANKLVKVRISSLQGQEVYNSNYAVDKPLKLNLQTVSQKGTYLITIQSERLAVTKKLVVE